jgi:RNA polymerase sigma factor (TIGR02999 family)
VHEAYLKLVDSPAARVQDRGHFLGLASRVMRHLLVDHARARRATKRGLGIASVNVDEATWISDDAVEPTIELDEALQRLASVDERRSRILEQRYFGGLSLEETAEALGVSLATVKRELRAGGRGWPLSWGVTRHDATLWRRSACDSHGARLSPRGEGVWR